MRSADSAANAEVFIVRRVINSPLLFLCSCSFSRLEDGRTERVSALADTKHNQRYSVRISALFAVG